jgi:hypothetical protein
MSSRSLGGKAMRRRRSIAIVLLSLPYLIFANVSSALAQAGSTGGSIGNDEKSISGDRPRAAPRLKQPAAKDQEPKHSCDRIVGRWSWYLGVSESVFYKGGSAAHPVSGSTGKWTCSGNTVSVVWLYQGTTRTDRITVSQDGNSIFVDSPWGGGVKFTGTRRGQ